MGFLHQGLGVADNAGQQPHDGLHHGQDGHFAAVEDVVPQAHGPDGEVLFRPLDDPLVDALVPAAGENQLVFLGKLVGQRLGEPFARG